MKTLVTCQTCGGKMVNTAKTCPHCGVTDFMEHSYGICGTTRDNTYYIELRDGKSKRYYPLDLGNLEKNAPSGPAWPWKKF